MADSVVFDWTCAELESATELDRLETRGTVRIALKGAGLDARSVSPDQMKVVLLRVLPEELSRRSVAEAENLCTDVASRVVRLEFEAQEGETPDEVFSRLAGGT